MAAPPRPISLRSCVANLLKWDRQALTLTLTLTLTLAITLTLTLSLTLS